MASLLDAIRAQQAGPSEPEPVVISQEEWDAWDGSDETCPWVLVGWNEWRHRETGQLYRWGEPIRWPGEER